MMKRRKMITLVLALTLIAANLFSAAVPAASGSVAGMTMEIQAKSKEISKKKAKKIALDNAKKNYGIKTSTIRDIKVEKDKYKGKKTWEVSFEAITGKGKHYYDFEYDIARSGGKILHREKERD
ncbi:MAG: hypothetical protein IJI25_01905 [Eubacterium sp.]|nr:hypothetical protein [Eubacterium sp.]